MTNIKRVYIAHTINTVALSFVGIYIPAYLLTLGFPLTRVVLFFVITHFVGLLFALFLFTPLVRKFGLINTFKINYPFQIIMLLLLNVMKPLHIAPEIIAICNGFGIFAYWIPLNIFFIKHSQHEDMGANMSKFFALPSLFGIAGPLIGAILVPKIGFWPVFIVAAIGVVASFIPLAGISDKEITINFTFTGAIKRVKRNKTLFLFEFFDNIIEESEWFWSVYVFLIIGSLVTPGVVGSLEELGGSIFTLFIGKFVNKNGKKLIPVTAFFLLVITVFKIFTHQQISAYIITVIASFLLNLFLVSYFSTIYKTIKNDNEEEFMILREVVTVLGRVAVFAGIFLTIHFLQLFFLLPIATTGLLLILYVLKRKHLAE